MSFVFYGVCTIWAEDVSWNRNLDDAHFCIQNNQMRGNYSLGMLSSALILAKSKGNESMIKAFESDTIQMD